MPVVAEFENYLIMLGEIHKNNTHCLE